MDEIIGAILARLNQITFTCRLPQFDDISAAGVSGTWYTLTDLTSAKGILTKIGVYGYLSTALNPSEIDVRITVDGTATTYDNSINARSRHLNSASGGSGGFLWVGHLKFKSSLKIEVRQTRGATVTFEASSDYQLVA